MLSRSTKLDNFKSKMLAFSSKLKNLDEGFQCKLEIDDIQRQHYNTRGHGILIGGVTRNHSFFGKFQLQLTNSIYLTSGLYFYEVCVQTV